MEAAAETVAVPEIEPLVVLRVNPAGRAGATAQDNAPVPPVAVTGVNAVIATPLVNVRVGTAKTVTTGTALTDRLKDLLLV